MSLLHDNILVQSPVRFIRQGPSYNMEHSHYEFASSQVEGKGRLKLWG
jgi:hypothetical protein